MKIYQKALEQATIEAISACYKHPFKSVEEIQKMISKDYYTNTKIVIEQAIKKYAELTTNAVVTETDALKEALRNALSLIPKSTNCSTTNLIIQQGESLLK